MRLDEAIAQVLEADGGWMKPAEIAAEIARLDLYRQQKGDHAPASQIVLRVRSETYAHHFECRGVGPSIRLSENPTESPRKAVLAPVPALTSGIALTENDVVEAVCRHLQANSWQIRSRASTMQQGVDVVATRGPNELRVEAKGGTSSKPGTARYGKGFTLSQVKSHVARAFYTAARSSLDANVRSAMAFPTTDRHLRVVDAIRPAADELGIWTFWVDVGGSVSLEAPWDLS